MSDSEIHLPHHHSDNTAAVLRELPHNETIQTVAEAMKQLGDPSRLRIFWLLCHCEECHQYRVGNGNDKSCRIASSQAA